MSSLSKPSFIELFSNTPIYCIKEEKLGEEATTSTASQLNYLGNNQKGVVFLIETEDKDFLKSKYGSFLLKIASAVSLRLSDIAIINIADNRNINDTLSNLINYQTLISFDTYWEAARVFKQMILYKAEIIENKTLLVSESLNKLENDIEAKKVLWQTLKEVFK